MKKFMIILFILAMLQNGLFAKQSIKLSPLGTFRTGLFDESAQEILSYDQNTQRLFVVNGGDKTIDVIDISNPQNLTRIFQIDLSPYGKQANSVSVHNGIVVAAVENVNKQAPGQAVFFDTNGKFLNKVTVGALPDMITFTPNGRYVLVANEGEPNDDYTVDPEGSISIIRVKRNIAKIRQKDVKTAHFRDFQLEDLPESVKIFGPNASVAQDLEPEYIAVSKNSKTAWVTLQENNAIAQIDIEDAEVEEIYGLGYKNHLEMGNGLDVSNNDNAINIANWPILGVFQPDSISTYRYHSKTFLVTANEGDSRDYPGYSEEERVKDLILNPLFFPDAADLQLPENLGRLKITTALGDMDHDGQFEQLMSYGARSFSIWSSEGELVYDSGDDFEKITAQMNPSEFNSSDTENFSFDDRSDDKGPEPEAIVIGKAYGQNYAFIGLERMGGIMVYNVTNPYHVRFVQYINTRDFNGNPADDTAGDLAPEGFSFIKAEDSPTGKPILAVAFEVSGSTTLFEITKQSSN